LLLGAGGVVVAARGAGVKEEEEMRGRVYFGSDVARVVEVSFAGGVTLSWA
jgi:hypothetical protein